MKTLSKLLLAIAGLFLALMLLTGLAAKALLSGERLQSLLSTLESRLPVKISASGGSFDLAAWFRFQPAVAIREVIVGNPPGFSSPSLLEAEKVSARVALVPLLRNRLEIQSLVFERPHLTIERDSQGRSNAVILLAVAAQGGSSDGRAVFLDRFEWSGGIVRFLDGSQARPVLTLRDLDFEMSGFAPGQAARLRLVAGMFEGTSSRLELNAKAGPFGPESVAAVGRLSVRISPSEMPAALREKYLGDLLREPGGDSRVELDADLSGDLMKSFQGDGKLRVSSLQTGQGGDNRMKVEGEAPLQVAVREAFAKPSFDLSTRDASVTFGEGLWRGDAQVHYDGSRFRGDSRGSVSGVRIQEVLAAFTRARGTLFGSAEVPEYSIRFAGADAAEVRDSLDGTALLRLGEGRIAVLDLAGAILERLRTLGSGEAPAAGETRFTRLESSLKIGGGKILLSDLVVESPSLQVTGQGSVTFDRALDFDLMAQLPGKVVPTAVRTRLGADESSPLRLPVRVQGTVETPKVYPDISRLAKEKAKKVVEGLLDKLKKKIGQPDP